jgi:hypothetical protein
MLMRPTAVAFALALCACVPLCLNGSLDFAGHCTAVTDTSECVMKHPGDRCLDTGTCNAKQECEVPGVTRTQ